MKRILIILTGIMLFSCNDDFLDQVPDDRLTFDETFESRNTVERYLASIYDQIPSELDQRYTASNSGPWIGASDNAEYVWSFHLGNYFNVGDWDPTTGHVSSLWSNFYRAIRASTTFMNNIDQCTDCSEDITNQYIAEARVLRAYFYYNLLRLYGPVILMGENPIPPDAGNEALDLERNSITDVVNYIVSELDKGADELDGIPFTGPNAGRMSRPFALAIKEKTLLFAASPLFNGNPTLAELQNSEGQPLAPQSYDVNKWQSAANAAKAFIDEFVPGTYKLYKEYNADGTYNAYLSCRNVMINDWNQEMIYARPRGGIAYHYDCTPYHLGYPTEVRGAGGLSMTQEMVDAYFMANGRSIDDPDSGYQTEGFSDFQAPFDFEQRSTYNQWINREPRFYVGVTYNRSLWLNRNFGNIITTTWYAGNSGRQAGTNDYPPTGYIVRKNVPIGDWRNSNRTVPMMRLGEIYLDYAEALNEYDPGNADILKYLNLIRERAGIPEYGSESLAAPGSQEAMRDAIRKERRVELAFESVRYFDARRWKTAEDDFSGPFHGLDINARNEEDFYNVVVFENRVFEEKHYLWPIPQDEINSNSKLIQNPGW
ncbi:MAG: RagB/SusD family nutrient uptake outer membrane protein [Bacteroidota bacterium]|uniref:RagB/SusD family nutrient uptake outer membrane protein n=1 Tax=Christiangramia sp. TaxID=1931228 RepID=UPI000C5853D1|nr:RagB/SusD family nutrient uptake outer membrane protein [Christiangramia sp.]MEE2772378.1 RagB/SusD family nutrient uptake outer membrane protein [Bacteroidota bacterium]